MNFTLETSVPAITVFLQGLISFFSPCVLPLIPLYIGYLSGGAKTVDEDGNVHYKRSRVLGNTLFFVIGISFAFFLLGLGFTAIGTFFHNYQTLFTRIGGIIIILFGLTQLGLFGDSSMGKERRLPFSPNTLTMNPWTALILGFTFSFAWTPCVGPALASVLIMAASASSHLMGFVLIGVYTLGFTLPFLAVGLFTGKLLEFFKKNRKVVKYTTRLGGALMLLIGIMMFTGWMNSFSSYLSGVGTTIESNEDDAQNAEDNTVSEDEADATDSSNEEVTDKDTTAETPNKNTDDAESSVPMLPPAPDFTLTDQYGNTHTLSDYKGKTVFLNFWATWCPPCRAEMPSIQELYEEYGYNEEDVVILGVAFPDRGKEGSAEDIISFLEKNEYTYPVLLDKDAVTVRPYRVISFPTTFMIDKNGNYYGHVSGQLTKDIMISIIEQTIKGAPAN